MTGFPILWRISFQLGLSHTVPFSRGHQSFFPTDVNASHGTVINRYDVIFRLSHDMSLPAKDSVSPQMPDRLKYKVGLVLSAYSGLLMRLIAMLVLSDPCVIGAWCPLPAEMSIGISRNQDSRLACAWDIETFQWPGRTSSYLFHIITYSREQNLHDMKGVAENCLEVYAMFMVLIVMWFMQPIAAIKPAFGRFEFGFSIRHALSFFSFRWWLSVSNTNWDSKGR